MAAAAGKANKCVRAELIRGDIILYIARRPPKCDTVKEDSTSIAA